MNRWIRIVAPLVLVGALVAACGEQAPAGDDGTTAEGLAVGFTQLSSGQVVAPDHAFGVRASSDATLTEVTLDLDGRVVELAPRGSTNLRLSAIDDLADGSYEMVVTATDSEERAVEASVTFTVDASVPSSGIGGGIDDDAVEREVRAALAAPTGGAVAGDVDVVAIVEARNVAASRVSFFVGETVLDAPTTVDALPSSGAFTRQRHTIPWDTTLFADGETEVRVVAESDDGVVSDEATVQVTVANDDEVEPEVSWVAPSGGDVVTGTVTLLAEATDDVGVERVRFFANGSLIDGTVTQSGDRFELEWDATNVAGGEVTLEAVARDAAGNRAVAEITVDVLSGFSITNPEAGASVGFESRQLLDISVGLNGTLPSGTAVTNVEIFVSGVSIGDASELSDSTGGEFYLLQWDVCDDPSAEVPGNVPGDRTLTALVEVSGGDTYFTPGVLIDHQGNCP